MAQYMDIVECIESEFDSLVAGAIAERIVLWQDESDDFFRLGLTGGSSVRGVYEALVDADDIDWTRVLFIVTDERFVSFEDENSNWGMIDRVLFQPLNIAEEQIVTFSVSGLERHESADLMNGRLQDMLAERAPLFDLLLLGVGPDGHVASVFPDSPTLASDSLAMMAETEEFAVRERLTLTLKALTSANEVLLLLKGERKREIFELAQKKGELPVQKLAAEVDDVKVVFGV